MPASTQEDRHCPVCDVSWYGDGACWSCGGGARQGRLLTSLNLSITGATWTHTHHKGDQPNGLY